MLRVTRVLLGAIIDMQINMEIGHTIINENFVDYCEKLE